MLKMERFNPDKTYMFVNGSVATPAAIREAFPAVDHFQHILEVNGDVVQAVMNLNAMRGIHKIDNKLSEDEAIAAIEAATNAIPEEIVSPEERTASAMEFQNIMMLDDVPVNSKKVTATVKEDNYAKLIKRNYDRGLWSEAMLTKAVKKGALSDSQHSEIVSGV